MSYKLGSLFDGSGGFPLSGTLCDIEPMWAAEVEPYPIAVTSSRFPNMKHLGDISKVNGAEIEPVDIITFGSPCQDLSVAGKRAGLKHEDNGDDETTRSGLFMEAVRIIKEMRKATNGQHPRFAVWENVPGAFSSNNGEDFRVVLQELIKIAEPYAVMPEVPKNGWAYADSYCGDGWSIAYRVFDAQHWGVPKRRRRIYLVADFRGGCAEEILFEREGLRGYFAKSGTPGQTVTPDVEGSLGADDREGAFGDDKAGAFGFDRYNQCSTGDVSETVRCPNGGDNYPTVCYGISSYDSNSMRSSNPHSGVYEADTSRTLDGNGGNPSCNQGWLAIVQGIDGYNGDLTGDKSATLGVNCGMSTGRNGVITDTHILDDQGGSVINVRNDGKVPTLRAMMGGHPPVVMIPESAEGLDAYNQVLTGDKAKTLNSAASDSDHVPCAVYSVENHPADSRVNLDESGKVQTLTSRMGTGGGNVPMVMEEVPRVINLNKDDVQSKTILDPKGIAPSLYAGECRGGGGECYVMEPSARADELAVHGTAYSFDPGASRDVGVLFIEECGKTLTNGTCPGHHDGVVVARPCHTITTGSFTQIEEEKSPTLMARDYKDPTCVEFYDERTRNYIVRRLTPTECARLQGFPDKWGHIEPKTELTDDEYRFWLEVRKTHDAINGRAVKDYNEKQMLTYYNKLWTDSAEYKMWGNGIALPCALYVMQGIKEALDAERTARSKWLDELLGGL